MSGESKWLGGRSVILLFSATVVLPALVLAVLAYRALDSDRQLAERAWRERLEDASRRAFQQLERRIADSRGLADAISRDGHLDARASDGMIALVFSPGLRLRPAARFAWVPDGRAPIPEPLPAELEQAESQELRLSDTGHASTIYDGLLRSVPARWRGWIHLRRARVLARAGETAASQAALRQAATLPDSSDGFPTQFAARFELAASSPDEAARLYRDLNSGRWLLEKSPYTFYAARLRGLAAGRISPEIVAAAREREALSQILEKVLAGESGWLTVDGVSAMVTTAANSSRAAVMTTEAQLKRCLGEAAKGLPGDLSLKTGASAPADARLGRAVSLAPLGLPWFVWSEPKDPHAPARDNASRGRLLQAALLLVAGVLAFGSFATIRLVQRELRIARLQSDFVATVSHEFRTPLTGIRQLGEMLLAGRAASNEPRRRQYYELICRESARLTRLVDNVLDFSRIEHGRREFTFARIDTAEWLQGIAGIAEQSRILETAFPVDLPAVEGDREALSSAVLNLLDNAIKYSHEGTPVSLRASGKDGWVTIEVRDRGCGIAPEDQRHIFDRFYRGSNAEGLPAKGVGLGLALVKRIADAHGARLRVESVPGQGSAFYLSLKAAV